MKIQNLLRAFADAAASGEWHEIPDRWLTEANASLADERGCNAVYLAAAHGLLGRMPIKLLTERTVCAPTGNGDSALRRALRDGHYRELPAEALLRHPEVWNELPSGFAAALRHDLLSLPSPGESSAGKSGPGSPPWTGFSR